MHSHLIAPGVPSDLSNLPFHDDGPLTRWLIAARDLAGARPALAAT